MKAPARLLGLAAILMAAPGCASIEVSGNTETSSPWVYGPGVRFLDYRAMNAPRTSLNPMAVYNLYFQEGGTVHRFEAGAQMRKYSDSTNASFAGLWFGGEAAVGYLHDRYEGGTSNHFGASFGPAAGLPLRGGAKPVHLIGATGLSYYGSLGFNARIGVEWKR